MTLPTIRARIAALEAQLAEAAVSTAHNADTVWAVTLGELNELLEQNVKQLAEGARRIEDAGMDCTKADDAYMEALFALHDFNFRHQEPRS